MSPVSPVSSALRRAILLATLSLACATEALAEPALAMRTGYRCSQCHLNRTGGGMRTPFGSLYSQTVLPRRLLRWRDENNLLPADPDARFAVGGDARFQALSVVRPDLEDTFSFEIPEANLYLEGRLLPEWLSVYLDGEVGPGGAAARELFAIVSLNKWDGYVKMGKFLPPFGWRLPDDQAYIRQFTGFTYSAPDTGIEVGIEPGRWSLHLAAVNGSSGGGDEDRAKQFSFLGVRRFQSSRIGLSASNNISGGVRTTLAGLVGGVNLGRLSLLAEADWGESRQHDATTGEPESPERLLGFLEADLLITRGLTLKYTHDWMDPARDVETDARARDSLGVEFIPYPFIQLRMFVRRADGPPQVRDAQYVQTDLELHIFF